MPTYEDIRLINSQENIKKLEILDKIPESSVAFTNDYNTLDNLPDLTVLESIEDSPKPVQSAAIYKELKEVNATLKYTKELAESNADAAYTNTEYYGNKTFYATTKFGFMSIKPISYELVEISAPNALDIKANPLILNSSDIHFSTSYPYTTMRDLQDAIIDLKERLELLEEAQGKIVALDDAIAALGKRVEYIESDYVKHEEIQDFVTKDEMDAAIRRHIAFDVTDVVKKDSEALVTSGGVWNAIDAIDTMQELHPYRDILLYMAEKRRDLEYDVLHLLCSKMPKMMAVLLQVEIKEKNDLATASNDEVLTPQDWHDLREVVDVHKKLFDFLSRIKVNDDEGNPVKDLPLESGH